jgi:hypothetical protein
MRILRMKKIRNNFTGGFKPPFFLRYLLRVFFETRDQATKKYNIFILDFDLISRYNFSNVNLSMPENISVTF